MTIDAGHSAQISHVWENVSHLPKFAALASRRVAESSNM